MQLGTRLARLCLLSHLRQLLSFPVLMEEYGCLIFTYHSLFSHIYRQSIEDWRSAKNGSKMELYGEHIIKSCCGFGFHSCQPSTLNQALSSSHFIVAVASLGPKRPLSKQVLVALLLSLMPSRARNHGSEQIVIPNRSKCSNLSPTHQQ